MPFSREQKAKAKAARYGRDHGEEAQASKGEARLEVSGLGHTRRCCRPGGCLREESLLNVDDLLETERVSCSWEGCTRCGVMHRACFNDFEDQVLIYLKGTGRARSWSEKQRRQNLWNKKGYDLAFKACNCDCGKGFLRKDMDYKPPHFEEDSGCVDTEDKRKKKSKKPEKPTINVGKSGSGHTMSHARTHSSSSGYSTSSSLSGSMGDVSSFGLSSSQTARKSSADSCFQKRADMSAFRNALPRHRMNSYNIRVEDDQGGPLDELRQLVITGLMSHRLSKVPCCLCRKQLAVYDKYPVVDGIICLTPLEPKAPQRLIPLRHEAAVVYLLAVCLHCALGKNRTVCTGCSAPWIGENLVLGAIYSFDIFSSSPCCEQRTLCSHCREPAIQLTGASMLSYSQCSGVFSCENCGHEDAHLVRPLSSYDVTTVVS